MGGTFIQDGSLTGAVSANGTLQAKVDPQGTLEATITPDSTLQGDIVASQELQATVVPQEQLEATVDMPEKVVIEKSVNAPQIGEVTLLASAWVSHDNLHSQVVNIKGTTENSQVDLTPSVEQLLIFYEKDLTFTTKNKNGVVTVYAIGQRPTNDYTIQVTITEVEV